MQATFHYAGLWRHLVDAMADIAPNISLSISFDGLRLQTMDRSNVLVAYADIHSSALSFFACDAPMTAQIDGAWLKKCHRGINQDDELTVFLSDSVLTLLATNRLHTRIAEYTAKLVEPETHEEVWMEIPDDLDHSSNVIVSSLILSQQLAPLVSLADEMAFCVSKDSGFSIEPLRVLGDADRHVVSSRVSIGSCVPTVSRGSMQQVNVSTKMFAKLVSLAQLSAQTSLGITEGYPVELRVDPGQGIVVRGFCAPRRAE